MRPLESISYFYPTDLKKVQGIFWWETMHQLISVLILNQIDVPKVLNAEGERVLVNGIYFYYVGLNGIGQPVLRINYPDFPDEVTCEKIRR